MSKCKKALEREVGHKEEISELRKEFEAKFTDYKRRLELSNREVESLRAQLREATERQTQRRQGSTSPRVVSRTAAGTLKDTSELSSRESPPLHVRAVASSKRGSPSEALGKGLGYGNQSRSSHMKGERLRGEQAKKFASGKGSSPSRSATGEVVVPAVALVDSAPVRQKSFQAPKKDNLPNRRPANKQEAKPKEQPQHATGIVDSGKVTKRPVRNTNVGRQQASQSQRDGRNTDRNLIRSSGPCRKGSSALRHKATDATG